MCIRFKSVICQSVLFILTTAYIIIPLIGFASDNMDKEKRLEWFKEAKYGMFIHWGPYAHFNGEWNGKRVAPGEQAEWIMKNMEIPVKDYREHTRSFNPVEFNAREWVQIAQNAGMKYIVITAKHHDGFAMYDSKASDYNIVDWTPFDRDPLKELAAACKDEGLRFCVYYSHREDWDHPGAYGNGWDYDNDWAGENWEKDLYKADGNGRTPMMGFKTYLEEKAIPQVRELMTEYGPIGLVWFDRGIYTLEQGRMFVDLVHNLQSGCLINSRVGHYYDEQIGDYQSLGDNRMPIGGIDEYWETPQTLNGTWGYNPYDELWKSPEEVLDRLVKIVSCGGNYLLNVGPTGEGIIPGESVRIITEAGQWVSRNAESIYGTTASPFSELPFGYCTVKGSRLFVHIRDWPENGAILLPGLRSTVITGYFLLDKSKKVSTAKTADGVTVSLPGKPLDSPMTVVVLELADRIKVDPSVVAQGDDGTISPDYLNAITTGKTVKRYGTINRFHIAKWTGPEDTVSWNIQVDKAGTYTAGISYAAVEMQEGRPYIVSLGGDSIEKTVRNTGNKWYKYETFPVGSFDIEKPGRYTLTIRPKDSGTTSLMYLKSITLTPDAK